MIRVEEGRYRGHFKIREEKKSKKLRKEGKGRSEKSQTRHLPLEELGSSVNEQKLQKGRKVCECVRVCVRVCV